MGGIARPVILSEAKDLIEMVVQRDPSLCSG